MRMTVLASGSKGNSAVVASHRTRVLVDAGLSCRELLRRMALAGEDPSLLDAILVTHEHQDHVIGLAVLARRFQIPVFFTEPTHRAWIRTMQPRSTLTYAAWLDRLAQEREAKAAHLNPDLPPYASSLNDLRAQATVQDVPAKEPGQSADACHLDVDAMPSDSRAEACDPEVAPSAGRPDPTSLPAVEYFKAGVTFSIGDLDIVPFTIPHDAADPCGFVFASRSESIRMAVATDLGYIPPNVKAALREVDVLLLESNHDLEMLKDGPYPWSVKQRVLSRVGHLSNNAAADFLEHDYDGGAAYVILGHLSESNNAPELARIAAEQAIGDRLSLLGNRILVARQDHPLECVTL